MGIRYTTGRIAQITGLHPNTVRKYEEWGLISRPKRASNGYRIYTELHIMQFELAAKAFQIEVLQSGLRKLMMKAVRLSAEHRFDESAETVREYIRSASEEKRNAAKAAGLCGCLLRSPSDTGVTYKRSEAAQKLNLTTDTIRNWEMNGLIRVKRMSNGYRIYDSDDMDRLIIIRTLRNAGYSLSSILRMLTEFETKSGDSDIISVLNTPGSDEDIITACDRLIISLDRAIENAQDMICIISRMKEYTRC